MSISDGESGPGKRLGLYKMGLDMNWQFISSRISIKELVKTTKISRKTENAIF